MRSEQHRRITAIACELAKIDPEYIRLMSEESMTPDKFDDYYIALGGFEPDYFSSRTYLHLYDPVHDYGGAPLECLRYTVLAKDMFNIGNNYEGYKYLGYASHYIEDVATPVHTDMDVINQLSFHLGYEDWINLHWNEIENRLFLKLGEIGIPIKCDYVREHIKKLATISNGYIEDVWEAMKTKDTEMLYSITVPCVLNAVLYTAGYYNYVFTAEEIVEEFKLPPSALSIFGSIVLIGLAGYGAYKILTRKKRRKQGCEKYGEKTI